MYCCLADFIAGHRRLAEPDARNKFWQIIHAVKYCHQRGIVHRDLKVHCHTISLQLYS